VAVIALLPITMKTSNGGGLPLSPRPRPVLFLCRLPRHFTFLKVGSGCGGDGRDAVMVSVSHQPTPAPPITSSIISKSPRCLTGNSISNASNGYQGTLTRSSDPSGLPPHDQHHYHHSGYSHYHTMPHGRGNGDGTGLAFILKLLGVAVGNRYQRYQGSSDSYYSHYLCRYCYWYS
jgi:hypothetical protein